MTEQDRIVLQVLFWLHFDWAPYSAIEGIVANSPSVDESELIDTTLGLITNMIANDLIILGDLQADVGFVPWILPVNDIISKVALRRLDIRRLGLYDVCWVDLTEKGLITSKRLSRIFASGHWRWLD